MQDVSAYYDRYWGGEQLPEYLLAPELEGLLKDNVRPADDCVDVGCGAGQTYAQWVARTAGSYVGADISSTGVAHARASGLDARVIEDAATLPFEDASFDLAICIEVFEHLFEPLRAAEEIHRILRPGGRLVASMPNVTYWRMRWNHVLGIWNPAGDHLAIEQPWRDPHIRFFDVRAATKMLRAAGFSTVEVGAHNGRFLGHLTMRPTRFEASGSFYRRLEKRSPSLLDMTLHVLAVKG